MKCNRCGKENPAEIHTCTPPPWALKLADMLTLYEPEPETEDLAAAELRRLHAENIELAAKVRVAESGFYAAVQTARWQESTNRELNRHLAQKAELRAENEALREALDEIAINTHDDTAERVARAALARAGEVK